jgi:imidazolonepropionase-like amidohydrolase
VRFPGAKDVLKMACGENPKRVYGQGRKSAPSTRMGNVAGYRQAFQQAKEYAARWDEYRKKAANAKPHESLLPPARELRWETLAAVLRGEILVQNHCYKADEMQMMLDVADEFGFKIRAFHHALEAYKVRDLLARRDVASATWADWFGFKMEAWDGIPWNAGLLQTAGARVVIHSDSADGIQRLNQEAGKALASARAEGLAITDAQAIRWFTWNAAWVLGVEEQTGSLEAGKMADLVLWNGNPLSVYARAQKVFADGVLTYDSKTGPVEPSDFEVGEAARSWARLTPHPAAIPVIAASSAAPLVNEGPANDCTAITNATLVGDGAPKVAPLVLLRAGKIAEAGAVPAGCRVVDAKGLVLSPGFIEPSTDVGLTEIGGEERTQDASPQKPFEPTPIRAALRAEHSYNPASALLPIARTGGVTAVLSTPGGGLVSGQSVAIGTDGSLIKAQGALHLHLGNGGHDALGSTRGAALQLVRELFDDARQYAARRADFEKNQMRKVSASRLDLEALQEVLSGQLPVVVHADRASDLRAALLLARDFKLRLILQGAAEAWQLAAELAQAKVPVIVTPTQDLPDDFDQLASRPDNAALLAEAGVKVLFTSEGPDHVRALGQQAGNAVAWGMPYEEALRAMTGNVADAFGLDTGRIKPGARADVVLWSGDPLEFSSRPLALWIGGKRQPLRSRQHDLLEKYRTLPAP